MSGDAFSVDRYGRLPKEQTAFLLESDHMKGKYLGACLESCRWGSPTTVLYEMDITDMVHFVQVWLKQNNENFSSLFHYFNDKVELPYINFEVCPKNEDHKYTVFDVAGMLRCGYRKERVNLDTEKRTLEVCYAILSDKNLILSLETVITRLNIRHEKPNNEIEFPFTGWCLAEYVEKWWQQFSGDDLKWFGN